MIIEISKMDERIVKFIKKHHVMTLATVAPDSAQPWCSNIFYAYLPKENAFVFTSSVGTRHVDEALANQKVACSIVLESKIVSKVQGVQITGVMTPAPKEDYKGAFLKAFPYAVFSLEQLWKVEILTAKFTDNALGFGTKIYYDKFTK